MKGLKAGQIRRKTCLRIVSAILFLILTLEMNSVFRYILLDDGNDEYAFSRIMMHEFYQESGKIESLFCGSSHSFCSLNPAVTDSILGENTFNCGTANQRLDGTYSLIKEALKYNKLNSVYVEMFYFVMGQNYKEQPVDGKTYYVSDYMRPSINRIEYLWNAGTKDYFPGSVIYGKRYQKNLFDFGYMLKTVRAKQRQEYKNYDASYIINSQIAYGTKGYLRGLRTFDPSKDKNVFEPVKNDVFSDDDLKYINKIIDICKRKNVSIVFYSSPMPPERLIKVGNYDSYIAQIENLLDEKDVKYYDFNLCRSDKLQLDTSCYLDNNHLNEKGAEIFSRLFAEFFAGEITEEQLFYQSYKEKTAKENIVLED